MVAWVVGPVVQPYLAEGNVADSDVVESGGGSLLVPFGADLSVGIESLSDSCRGGVDLDTGHRHTVWGQADEVS